MSGVFDEEEAEREGFHWRMGQIKLMDVIIVCHTEFGFVLNKRVIFDKDATIGVKEGVKNLVDIADEYGAKVAFAVCPEVAKYFPKDIKHEIGLHIHPGWLLSKHGVRFKWYVGDSYLKEHCQQSINSSLLRDYSYQEQLEMIKTGKEYLTEVFGVEPKAFVAGKWSINNDTVKALIEAGITHECSAPAHSISDHHDWSKLSRICMPYHPSEDDYQKKGSLPLLIVPISQMLRIGNVNPEVAPIVGLPWLKACFTEYYRQNLPLFHICLHSPAMTDPYFISAMDGLLKFISKHNVKFKFASEVEEYDSITPKTSILPYLFGINTNIMQTFLATRIRKLAIT